ncbi:MAG: penicillin-binding protein 2 [Gemmatimonadetes bacterium]|nr:penicillin-binding protein 2 [Gemmatimonadota bacterium]
MKIKHLERILSTCFVLLLLGLVYLQIVEGERYRKQSDENIIRLVPISAPRGSISDRHGVVLADHRLTFDVAIVPQETENLAALIEKLSELTHADKEILLSTYSRNVSTPFMPATVLEDIEKETAIMLEERRDLPGTMILITSRRHYSYGSDTVHLLGVISEIPPKELKRLRPYGYAFKDLLGQGGIEESFDNYLRGTGGGTQLKVNSKGYKVATLGYRPATKGKDLTLTVDIRLQRFIHSLFDGKKGAACVMHPETGEILALVSSPSFNPNEDFSTFLHAEEKPFLNRVTQGRYPPGSTFKLVVATMALEEGKITPDTSFRCSGLFQLGDSEFKCWRERGHGEQHLIEAIRHSCNIYFYRTALLGGAELLASYAKLFGFGKRTQLELPYEAAGLVPTPFWKRFVIRERWYPGDTVNFAIGQGYLSVTPLQLLRMASVIAADGKLVEPYVVKQIGSLEVKGGRYHLLPISEETLSVIRQGMIEAVNTPDGTGQYAAVEGFEIAGKTGTAQNAQGEDHGWFIAFAPADNPVVVAGIIVEFAEHGSRVAPLVNNVIARHLLGDDYQEGAYQVELPADSAPASVPIIPVPRERPN